PARNTLALHDALPISQNFNRESSTGFIASIKPAHAKTAEPASAWPSPSGRSKSTAAILRWIHPTAPAAVFESRSLKRVPTPYQPDRKSTRLNSSHQII